MATLDCVGIAVGVIGLGYSVYSSFKSSSDSEQNQQRIEALFGETLDEIRALRTDITETLNALQLQLLSSAAASSSSALSQLDGYAAQPDDLARALARSNIIDAATFGFANVAAQSRVILGDDPTIDEVLTVFSTVNYALQVRLMVAAQLESGAIGSDPVRQAIEEARDIIDDIRATHLPESIAVELSNGPDLPNALDRTTDVFFASFTHNVAAAETESFAFDYAGPITTDSTVNPDIFGFPTTGTIVTEIQTSFTGLTGFAQATAILSPLQEDLREALVHQVGFGDDLEDLAALIGELDELSDGEQVNGTGGADTLTATDGDDFIFGLQGDDQIYGFDDSDVLRGDDGDDLLYAGGGNDGLFGGPGDDRIYGGNDADILNGGPGNDVISGGTGTDGARFDGAEAAYTITGNALMATVSGPDGVDTLHSVEEAIFDDIIVQLPPVVSIRLTKPEAEEVAYLYEAGLDRDGNIDLPGLNFWINVREAGMPVEELALEFLLSPEFNAFGEPLDEDEPDYLDNEAFVDLLYTNVLDRMPDQDGFDFWLGLANGGMDRPQLLNFFAQSPENLANSTYITTLEEVVEGNWAFV